jgi:hypothetical protein
MILRNPTALAHIEIRQNKLASDAGRYGLLRVCPGIRRRRRVSSELTVFAFIKIMPAIICRAVGNRALKLVEQRVLLSQKVVFFAFQHVMLDSDHNGRIRAALVEHLARVQAHDPVSEVWEFVLNRNLPSRRVLV